MKAHWTKFSIFFICTLASARPPGGGGYHGNPAASQAMMRAAQSSVQNNQRMRESLQRAAQHSSQSRQSGYEALQRARSSYSPAYPSAAQQRAEIQRYSPQPRYSAPYVPPQSVIIGQGSPYSQPPDYFPQEDFYSGHPEYPSARSKGSKSSNRFSIDPGVVSVDGVPVPRGATHYVFENGNIRYLGGEAVTESPTAATPSAPKPEPVPHLVTVPMPDRVTAPEPAPVPVVTLPTESFPALYGKFSGNKAVGIHAALELLNEPIAPQSLDEPLLELPPLSGELAKEITRDRLATIKALFDNSDLTIHTELTQNSSWTGRCVFRSTPNSETAAVINMLAIDPTTRISVLTAATATELMADPASGQVNKFDILSDSLIASIKGELEQADEALTTLRLVPLQERPFLSDALFFDGKDESNQHLTRLGFRLRTFKGLAGKTILVTEAYSPFNAGVAFAGKRVAYLEPIQYCYFTKAMNW